MNLQALITLVIVALASILASVNASAMDRHMECTMFPVWLTLNADGSVTSSDASDNTVVPVSLDSDPNVAGLHKGKAESPVGDSGEFKIRILATLNTNESDPTLDNITVDTALMNKDKEGKFVTAVIASSPLASSGDTSNGLLGEIFTSVTVRNSVFDKAQADFGLSSDEIASGIYPDDYSEMVKQNKTAPKTLSNIRINCAIPKAKLPK